MMHVVNDAAAFVLAGGASSRMGRDKAGLVLRGKTLLERAVDIARAAGGEVCIVGSGDYIIRASKALRVPVLADSFPGQGPLAGIHAALTSNYTSELNFVLAVDTPFVTPSFVDYLLNLARESPALVIAPRIDERLHPLCAVYRRAFAECAAGALAHGRNKIEAAIPADALEVLTQEELRHAAFDPAMFANLNTPVDFAEAERRMSR
jgi:molybdopterin-guanine dinucleotide biosynthesis protein A